MRLDNPVTISINMKLSIEKRCSMSISNSKLKRNTVTYFNLWWAGLNLNSAVQRKADLNRVKSHKIKLKIHWIYSTDHSPNLPSFNILKAITTIFLSQILHVIQLRNRSIQKRVSFTPTKNNPRHKNKNR